MTSKAIVMIAVVAVGCIIFYLAFFDEGGEGANAEINALNQLSIQIKRLNEKISDLSDATDQSNLLKTGIDELNKKLTIIQNDQSESRRDFSSIETHISSLEREMRQLNRKLSNSKQP
uniref:Uncharacterized protein n=1 Tax=Candidatus Kentrum sp. LFY TaxID=2126342 RepID=A0A450WS19_9GAMM|nr:MAG: hypothetical protein BECKLFY1418C_GA0070996_10644 [Candidatus Kentron sp. LFY]